MYALLLLKALEGRTPSDPDGGDWGDPPKALPPVVLVSQAVEAGFARRNKGTNKEVYILTPEGETFWEANKYDLHQLAWRGLMDAKRVATGMRAQIDAATAGGRNWVTGIDTLRFVVLDYSKVAQTAADLGGIGRSEVSMVQAGILDAQKIAGWL